MRIWRCNLCGKVFQSYRNCLQHRKLHSVVQPFICKRDLCHLSFQSVWQYQAHYRRHVNARPYRCRLCGKKFFHKNHHLCHRCGLHQRKIYKCHVCLLPFKEILSLSYHIRNEHSDAIIKGSKQGSKTTAVVTKTVSDNSDKLQKADNKILLKITAGTSMTIISPSKTASHEKKKKNKKSKRKHKEDSHKNGIILSIKKGSVNMSSETKLRASKQEALNNLNGLVNRVVESCDKGSNLKMKIKTLTEKSAAHCEVDTFSKYSYPSSPSNSKRFKKVLTSYSSDSESKSLSDTRESVFEDQPRVRNGIVIVKDKTGKLLAEQLQSAKAKKRENVFDSFSDVGLWKVLPSPRHESSLDTLKLRFSPQKPLRLDSGLDLSFEKTKYLDVASLKPQKTETYSEDSDLFEALPGIDKDSETGMQNVNDSGIEILSSSSCNRSNGNSVRSVVLDENSPTYFPREDSLLSLDSPANEIPLKAEHTVCSKCGGIVMETNNNAQSPRKCRCSSSLVNSPSQLPPSPVKSTSNIQPQDMYTASPIETRLQSVELNNCDNKFKVEIEKNKDVNETDDSDIMLIDCDELKQTNKVSEFDDVEIIRDSNSSACRKQNDLKLRLKLKPRKPPSQKKKNVEESLAKVDPELDGIRKHDSCDQQIVVSEHGVKTETVENLQTNSLCEKSSLNRDISPMAVLIKESEKDKEKIQKDILTLSDNKLNRNDEPCKKEVKKKPLFKVKKPSVSSENVKSTNDSEKDNDTADNEVGESTPSTVSNCVRKKKPIFKKRSVSGDSSSELTCSNKTDLLKAGVSECNMKEVPAFKNAEHRGITEHDSEPVSVGCLYETEQTVFQKLKKKVHTGMLESTGKDILATATTEISKPCLSISTETTMPKVEDDDSLLQNPHLEVKVKPSNSAVKKTCTSPLDLFQQQFLSFLSSNKPASNQDKSKDQPSGGKSEEPLSMNDTNDEKNVIKTKSENLMHIKQTEISAKTEREDGPYTAVQKKANNQNNKTMSDRKEKLSLKKSKSENKDSNERKNKSVTKIVGNKTQNDSQPKEIVREKVETKKKHMDKKVMLEDFGSENNSLKDITVKDEQLATETMFSVSNKTSNADHSHLETRTDSLSWLKIFSESIDNKSSAKKEEKNSSEEVTDFSADLAAINTKMDISDDELNALDVDDVFKSANLASLQPKDVSDRSVKSQKFSVKRPQKAKRSLGKFKRIRRFSDSNSNCSDSSSNSGTVDLISNAERDPDFNPFHDSDGDFDMESFKSRGKGQRKPRSKQLLRELDSDSDKEFTDCKMDASDEAGLSSRAKRLKQGRKSLCPCCLGSPAKLSRDYHTHHQYKLPKNSKQFVKSSLKLLELQAKIHQLFLSLFPDCAELISNSKIGTEEFEMLIDEVLGSLEGRDVNFEASDDMYLSNGCSTHRLYGYHDQSCCNSYHIPVHNPDGPDVLQTENTFHECFAATNSTNANHECAAGSEGNVDKCGPDNPCKDSLYPVDSAFNHHHRHSHDNELDITPHLTSKSESSVLNSHIVPPRTNYEALPQEFSASFPPHLSTEKPWNDGESMSCEDGSEVGTLDSIESDITITIDLNAAKVSLCRDPKNCLEKLHNRITRLVQCLLPKLKLRKPFFRNIDNLHFLLDLMITANLPGSYTDVQSSDDEVEHKLPRSSTIKGSGKFQKGDLSNQILSDSVRYTNVMSKKKKRSESTDLVSGNKDSNKSPEERVPLLSKFQDMFEQEIKSHRESLKKDVFECDTIAERGDQSSLLKAKEVLTTISKIEKMNKAKQKLRPRRDPRLRKRSEAETRKLFVQEKIQNNQYSSIVCHSSPKKSNRVVKKSRQRHKLAQNPKESFLSNLNLSETPLKTKSDLPESENNIDIPEETSDMRPDSDTDINDIKKISDCKPVSEDNLSANKKDEDESKNSPQDSETVTENSADSETKSENTGMIHDDPNSSPVSQEQEGGEDTKHETEDISVHEDADSRQKSGEKNIFELMQPS